MKTIVMMMLASSYSFLGCSQNLAVGELPSLVQNGLKTQFPTATDVEWEKNGNLFEAEFDINQTDHTALLDGTGKIVMHKQDIEATQLPEPVAKALRTNFSGYQIDDLEQVEKNGQTLYQVELEKNFGLDQKKVFSADGTPSTLEYWD